MAINGWEHYELEKEIAKSNMAQLLELFKREDDSYSKKCGEFVTVLSGLTEEGKKKFEEECELLEERRIKVALVIAEKLTSTRR